jgi:hypothetical protein
LFVFERKYDSIFSPTNSVESFSSEKNDFLSAAFKNAFCPDLERNDLPNVLKGLTFAEKKEIFYRS